MISSSMSATSDRSRKLSDRVLDSLLASIESREFPAGSLLPSERELMARYNVGRPAVREALQALANMGLLQIRHGGRARLLEIQPHDVFERMDRAVRHLLAAGPDHRAHLQEARLMFESGMVRLAAARATAADLDALQEALDRQRQAAGDAAQFVRHDIAFHVTITRASGNPIYSAVCEALLNWLLEFSPRLLRAPNTEGLTLSEHEAILRALESHDADAAVFAMRSHLTRANPLYGPEGRPVP
jgi:DNA-binding FadR family transcriptional regulator